MRKLSAIILLFILLFNMIGYRAWFYYAEKKADASMEARLDKDEYSAEDLVTLSIPLDNPYQLEQKYFQRASGEISFEGNTYQVVMRKVSGGNLVIRCLSDVHKTVLKKAKSAMGNTSAEQTNDGRSGSHNNLQKNYSGSDYTEQIFCLNTYLFVTVSGALQNLASIDALSDAHVSGTGKPPQYQA